MTDFDPIPIPTVPLEVGRDPSTDGASFTSEYLSEVKVINITGHEVSEIKTSVITLPNGAFPVPDKVTGSPAVAPISVFADDVSNGYVQWEPMGDPYPPSQEAPLGSYKYLRVKWDCYMPAGSNTANYSVGGPVSGPYPFYAEKIYTFRREEPAQFPNFKLTPGVLSALGVGCETPTTFEFSAHGFVNSFDFYNGLYGQDKQRAFPNGSSLLVAERDIIYDQNFDEVGSVTENPSLSNIGQECLAKEYTVRGRIVPELDYDGAAVEVIQEGDPVAERITIMSTSGRDAPPFWYNFNYELQHEKNIIPFSFVWGVGLLTYDEGTYNPQGATMDLQDKFGRADGTSKLSNNTGPRRRSFGTPDSWVSRYIPYNEGEAYQPTVFHSQDDITFSILGPDVVCHASSVNVCSVSTETINTIRKTVINWFDKGNQTWYDVEIYGYNFLPASCTWVLRGCLHINSRYLPSINLSTRDVNSQRSNQKEKTWAIDMNFGNRKLFTAYKNVVQPAPLDWINNRLPDPLRYDDTYQTACILMESMWNSDNYVNVTVCPPDVATQVEQVNSFENPWYQVAPFETNVKVGFLSGLHEPWAMNPIGIASRSGVAGEQPAFGYAGCGAILAGAQLPDARFLEAAIDLEWNNRLSIEVARDGRLVDQFDDAWTVKRFLNVPTRITNVYLNDAVKRITNDPNYQGWIDKAYDDPEFNNAHRLIDNFTTLGYYGSNVAYGGTEVLAKNGRGFTKGGHGGGTSRAGKTYGVASYASIGKVRGGDSRRQGDVLVALSGTPLNSTPIAYPGGSLANKNIYSIVYKEDTQEHYCIFQAKLHKFVVATNEFTAVSDTIGNFERYPGITYNPTISKFVGIGLDITSAPANPPAGANDKDYTYSFYTYTIDPDGSNITISPSPFYTDTVFNKATESKLINAIKFIEYNPADSKYYGFKYTQTVNSSGRINANGITPDSGPKLIELNVGNNSYIEKFVAPFDTLTEINDICISGTSNHILVPGRDPSRQEGQRLQVESMSLVNGAKDVIAYLSESEPLNAVTRGIAKYGDIFLMLQFRIGGAYEPGNNKIGYPTPKRQANEGYPSPGFWNSVTSREGFTPSHSAWAPLLSYAMISGDKLALKLVDYSMGIVMSTHHDGEPIRDLYYQDQGLGANLRNAARMEGRPLNMLVGGIGITRNEKLRRRVLYALSRRFWNYYQNYDWEDNPTGVPNKPWVAQRYPPWARGVSGVYDYNTKHPTWHVLGPYDSRFDGYWNANKMGINFKHCKYNTVGLPIREISPNFNQNRAAVWCYRDVGSAQVAAKQEVYVPPYDELDYVDESKFYFWSTSRRQFQFDKGRLKGFIASGYVLDPPRSNPGEPGTSVVLSNNVEYFAYKFECPEDPLATKVFGPPLPSQNVTAIPVSAHPSVTAVPIDLRENGDLEGRRPNNYSTQAYQQSLLFPFISPVIEVFKAYGLIFQEIYLRRPQSTLDFVCNFDTYAEVGDALYDTYLEAKQYFIDVAKTCIANMAGRADTPNTGSRFQGKYLHAYAQSSWSAERPYEWFTQPELSFTILENGNTDYTTTPYICESYFHKGERVKKKVMSGPKLGPWFVYSNQYSGGTALGSAWGTTNWATNAIIWAWEILYAYGDLSDSDVVDLANKAAQVILEFYGPGYDIELTRTTGALRNEFYSKALYGYLGWPSVGLNSRKAAFYKPGDPEVMPYVAGVTDNVFKDRTLNTTIKTITGDLRCSTELDCSFEVIDNTTTTYTYTYELQPSALYNPGKGVYPFFRQGDQKNALPRSIEAVRDVGMSALYVNGGETNQFDFTILEQQLNQIAANRCQANIRIHIDMPRNLRTIDEPGQPRRYEILQPLTQDYCLPKFLRTEFGGPVEGYPYLTVENSAGLAMSGYVPDYTSQALTDECVRLLTELGRVYDGDPRIIDFHVGLAGHWGEWNNYAAWSFPALDQNGNPIFPVRWTRNPPAAFLSTLAYAVDAAFKKTLIGGRFLDGRDNNRPLPDSPVLAMVDLNTRLGIHDDSFGWMSIDEPGKPWYTETQINHYGTGDKWKYSYMGGETRPELARNGDAYNTTYSGTVPATYSQQPQSLLECIRREKTSSLSEAIAFGYFYNRYNTQEQYDNMLTHIQTLGYSLFIQNSVMPTEVAQGENFNITVNVKNTGVAPFYLNWPLVVKFDSGARSHEVEVNYNLSSILPDTSVNITQSIDGVELQRSIGNLGTLLVSVYIKKPAAFLRDVTFQNAEHIESTPYMPLGSLSLGASVAKDIVGDVSGSSELSCSFRVIGDVNVATRDIGNESFIPKMDGISARLVINRFQNLETIGSSELYGDIEKQGLKEFTELEVALRSSLNGDIEKQGIKELIDLSVEGSSDLSGIIDSIENKDPPVIKLINGSIAAGSQLDSLPLAISRNITDFSVDSNTSLIAEFIRIIPLSNCDISGSCEPEVDTISKSIILEDLSSSSQTTLTSLLIDGFAKLPSAEVSGSSDLEGSFATIVKLEGDLESSSEASLAYLSLGVAITGDVSGSSDLDGDIFRFVFEPEFALGSKLDSSIFVKRNSIAGESRQDRSGFENLTLGERSVSRASVTNEIDSITRQRATTQSSFLSFEQKLLKELSKRSEGSPQITEIYRETLEYLINIFSQYVYINDQDELKRVPCWHGNTERVVAKLRQEHNIILPVVSVFRVGNTNDKNRRRTSSMIVYDKYWDNEKQRAVRVARLAPIPVSINYRLSVWTKYQEDMDQLTEQIHRDFNPDMSIQTSFNTSTKAYLENESPTNEVLAPEGQDRLIRKSFDVTVESYIPSPRFVITNTGKIEEFNSEVYFPIR